MAIMRTVWRIAYIQELARRIDSGCHNLTPQWSIALIRGYQLSAILTLYFVDSYLVVRLKGSIMTGVRLAPFSTACGGTYYRIRTVPSNCRIAATWESQISCLNVDDCVYPVEVLRPYEQSPSLCVQPTAVPSLRLTKQTGLLPPHSLVLCMSKFSITAKVDCRRVPTAFVV